MRDKGEIAAGVSVGGSQGVQAGTGNVQHNTYLARPKADLASLRKLNPYAAVTRIRQLPHDEAVDLFAGAVPGDVAELLKALIAADQVLAVAILGEIHLDLVRGLTASIPAKIAPWLPALPMATEDIAGRAATIGWDRDGIPGHLRLDGPMFFREYDKGRIYWSDEGGAHSIGQEFLGCYRSAELGYPATEREIGLQWFEVGMITVNEFGVIAVSGAICDEYGAVLHGEPVAAREDFSDHRKQRFEDGVIYTSRHGSFSVRAGLLDALGDDIPTSHEADAADSPYGTKGRVQRFVSRPTDYPAAIYSAGSLNRRVHGPALALYDRLGGSGGWLGFPVPTAEEAAWYLAALMQKDNASRRGSPYRLPPNPMIICAFEGGSILVRRGEAVSLPSATTKLISQDLEVAKRLGWPVTDERILATGTAEERVQFFDNGVVSWRRNKREVWLRP